MESVLPEPRHEPRGLPILSRCDLGEPIRATPAIGTDGIYVRTDADGSEAIAVPFEGGGLWGPIRGFLSLKEDRRTIRGITFHEQQETPGLGGEIASEGFRAQFQGKRIVAADGTPGIRIRRGAGGDVVNEVDGITGATISSKAIANLLRTSTVHWVPLIQRNLDDFRNAE